jgi:hypothetical protein
VIGHHHKRKGSGGLYLPQSRYNTAPYPKIIEIRLAMRSAGGN